MVSLISLAAVIEPQDLKRAAQPLRNVRATDLAELADLYLRAYSDGASPPDTAKAVDRIKALLDGAYGVLIPQACLLTMDEAGRATAAIVTIERDFGNKASTNAFIAELFTHPEKRREGLAEKLLGHAMHALHDAGRTTVSVTVDRNNPAAIALYLSRGFRRLVPEDDSS